VIATIAVFARLGDRPPPRKPPRLHPAEVGGLTVFTAAYHHRNRPETTSPACPSLDDLIAAKRLSRAETLDPWGTPYQVRCEGDYIDVRSAGEDRVPGTPDDIITNPSML
jgi:hypothetical protein